MAGGVGDGHGLANKVSFRDPANHYVAQYYDNQPTWETANPVTVVAGADTPGINAAADPVARRRPS